jgi:hypothetical protein
MILLVPQIQLEERVTLMLVPHHSQFSTVTDAWPSDFLDANSLGV